MPSVANPIAWPRRVTVGLCLLVGLVAGCGEDEAAKVDMEETDPRVRFSLTPLGPIPYPFDNGPNQKRIELGRLLFFDPILSGEKDTACGTCHHPDFAFADDRQFGAGASGVGLGADRVVSHSAVSGLPVELEPRNSPTVFNTAFNEDEFGEPSWMGFMFADGRIRGLEDQAKGPIASRVEMRGDAYRGDEEEAQDQSLSNVLGRLRAIPEYLELFAAAFAEHADVYPGVAIINPSTYGRAIAAYERELVTRNSAYDRYVEGDDSALTAQQLAGLELFHTKAKCAVCHSGPMFSDFRFVVQGAPQEGEGKDIIPGDDLGREEHTLDPQDRYAFRTTTLRNIELTAPYMHDGVLDTLREVVEFYNDGAQPRHPSVTDDMLDPDLKAPLGLSRVEMDALVAFMESLTDPGTLLDPMLLTVPESVPSGLPPVFGVNAP
ncbi:cytochrome-c peroxidase [Candidatus Poribacteria bacterium]|nr:cytochrome-c peroxidase [Candidatus Poribacteria bacterium]MBT5712985.1 cytochrome-c peroxidase [Candidatus Poribacteria bacterium]MBT7096344.1 cytochrome-c peroxidase [Candidatus Poribacteria bacterium]MBT7807898.1 cytochrome-c peroxidase [Candidatus Poribacteria bacterium]